MNKDKKISRYPIIDVIRFIAIALMVFFHLFYDLTLFGFTNIDFSYNPFWFWLPRLIVLLFMLAVGLSFTHTHHLKLDLRKLKIRMIKLTLCALIISVTTYLLFPDKWVYFGTLHCIAICSLLIIPFIKYPRVALITGLAILIPSLLGYEYPWIKMNHFSMDYIPPLPWLSYSLIGSALYHFNFHKLKCPDLKFIRLTSKYSLRIYLIHQPVLFAITWTVYQLSK